MKIFVFYDDYPTVVSADVIDRRHSINTLVRSIKEQLSGVHEIVETADQADMILVVGGDGFMVRTVKAYRHLNKPYLGINRGTIGFLLNDLEQPGLINELMTSAEFIEFPMLHAEIFDDMGQVLMATAFNDVFTKTASAQSAKHRITVGGQNLTRHFGTDTFCGDGIIISTPGGCTAYSRSAGGLAIFPDHHQFGFTPVCSYKPDRDIFLPLAIADDLLVEIEMVEEQKRRHIVIADNEPFMNVKKFTVRKSADSVKIGFARAESYYKKSLAHFCQKRTITNGGFRCA